MDDSTTLVAMTIPMFSLFVALVIIVVAMVLRSRGDARRHKERMLLAEKGMEIPRELYDALDRREARPNGFRAGRAWLLVLGSLLMFIGIGVLITLTIRDGVHQGINGLIPFFIGVGFMAAERLVARLAASTDKA